MGKDVKVKMIKMFKKLDKKGTKCSLKGFLWL